MVCQLGWRDTSNLINEIKEKTVKSINRVEEKSVLDDEDMEKGHTTTPGTSEQPQVFEEEDEKMEQPAKPSTKRHPYKLFFQRVLHLTAQKIVQMSDTLHINETMQQQMWQVMKNCLS